MIDLEKAYDMLNAQVFLNTMPSNVSVRYNGRLKRCHGRCTAYWKNGETSACKQEITLAKSGRTAVSEVNTLLHEMCHAWLNGHGELHHNHGVKWLALANYANSLGFAVMERSPFVNEEPVEETFPTNGYEFNGTELIINIKNYES